MPAMELWQSSCLMVLLQVKLQGWMMDVWMFLFFFLRPFRKIGAGKRRKMALLEIAQLECQLPKHSTTGQVAIPF